MLLAGLLMLPQAARAEALPQAWFEPFKTASEVGIQQFSQSPMLDQRNLPPVAERLPDDPVVVVPLDDQAVYGGVLRTTRNEWLTYPNVESALTISADLRTFHPNLAESWEVSPDGRHITFRLRKGLRWSDGHPLTSEDFVFAFNDLYVNEEFSPVVSRTYQGGRAVALDELTFRYEFPYTHPLFVNWVAQFGNFMVWPKHYYAQFHPVYTDREVVNARVAERGFLNWRSLVLAISREQIPESVNAPVLSAHRLTLRTLTTSRYERNPYYFKVDPQGRQLPYIDGIDSVVVDQKEVIAAMASSGQLDFSAFELRTQDIPLLKLGERTGDIRVLVWRRLHTSDVVIQPNFNYADERLRALFWDVRFRRALSLAVNRDEINELVYFGRGVPSQVTVHPSSSYYEPHFPRSWAEYDPAAANALLDELGLVDADGDGLREYPDGSDLTVTLEYIDFETPKEINLSLVASYWRDVGIDLRLKIVDASLQNARAVGGEMQMTAWHADRVTDVLFPLQPDWWVPRRAGWEFTLWNDWARWYMTRGRLGAEPPPIMRRLLDLTGTMQRTLDPDERLAAGKEILQIHADNVWTIGLVGQGPQPLVLSARMRGVPEQGIWGWDNRWTLAYHPATWYMLPMPRDPAASGSSAR